MSDKRLLDIEGDLSAVARRVCLELENDPNFLHVLPPVLREVTERAGHRHRIRRAEERIRGGRSH
jgi:hypothetical protein